MCLGYCMKLLVIKMAFNQNMGNANICSTKLTHVCWLSMQQISACQMHVANFQMGDNTSSDSPEERYYA